MTRAVRESASNNKFSRAVSLLPPGSYSLIPDYIGAIGRDRHSYELEMILFIDPKGPFKIITL